MAIQKLNGSDLLGQRITVDWAFIKPKPPGRGRRYVKNDETPFASCSKFLGITGEIVMRNSVSLVPRLSRLRSLGMRLQSSLIPRSLHPNIVVPSSDRTCDVHCYYLETSV